MKKMIVFFAVVVLTTTVSLSQGIEFSQIQNWTGTGNSVAILIIDFNDGETTDCWAFGYRFDGTKSAENMLLDIAAANGNFSVNTSGGFLNDLSYFTQEGLAADPFYWMTFVFADPNWEMNWDGIAEVLTDSMVFGCSYSDVDSLWNPLHLPENPAAAPANTSMNIFGKLNVSVYPNPVRDNLFICTDSDLCFFELFDASGKRMMSETMNIGLEKLNFTSFPSGVYILKLHSEKGSQSVQLIKE